VKTATASLGLVLAALTSSGCVVMEKKHLVMIVPPESNEVHLYYVFEGISVLEDPHSRLESAEGDLDRLKGDDFSFFVSGTDKFSGSEAGEKSPLLRHCRFEKLRFFVDQERKRPLCADRRMTILNRVEFAKILNKSISESFSEGSLRGDEKEIKLEITKEKNQLKEKHTRELANAFGMGPFFRAAEGVLGIADDFDLASIKQLKDVVKDGFRWLRFEPDTVRLVLPATPECAKRIAADPQSKGWLKEMRTFVGPIDLQTCDEGLAIVLGKKGQVIRLTYADTRPHRPTAESALAKYAGSPKAIVLDGKTANAGRLIEQFIAEKTEKR
jgi:hypothetical protein